MDQRTAAITAAAALLLGIAGDVLLRWIPWGLNVPLWTLLFLGVAIALLMRFRPQPLPEVALPAAGALIAAAGVAWRDSRVLLTLDILLLLFFLALLSAGPRNVRLAATGLARIAAALTLTVVQSVGGFFQLVFDEVEWKSFSRGGRRMGVFLRGTAIALPALVVFGVLLSSADVAFAKLLADIIRIDFRELLSHWINTLLVAAVCAGFLRSLLGSGELPEGARPAWLHLPAAEANVALGLINVLFGLFVMIQARYLFGRAPVAEMSYSDYARRGFFELVWVVALVMPMLLVAEWLIDRERIRLFRIQAAIQVALVLAIAASAYVRMQIYRAEFGLTELRYYCTAFMIFVAALLVWFALTVLTGRRARFAIGAIVTAVVTVVSLHVHNPDATILETNVARARVGQRPLDVRYAQLLSDDAAPVILRNADLFSEHALALVQQRYRPPGWRTWNWSRSRARYESNATPPSGRP
jgi:hypothetical protein